MRFILILSFLFSSLAFSENCFDIFLYKKQGYRFPYDYAHVSYSSTTSRRAIESLDELRLGTYNLENFGPQSVRLNSLEIERKTKRILGAIKSNRLDIVTLQEVVDIDYLKRSVQKQLRGKYSVVSIQKPGNPRSITFLVKNDLPFEFKLHSFMDHKVGSRVVFSKDFPVLEVQVKGKPILFYGGLHLKSKRGGDVGNNFYEGVRKKQLKAALEIKKKVELSSPGVPFAIAGDFNNDLASNALEFESLKKLMSDSFDLSGVHGKKRLTHLTSYKGQRITSQLDGILYSNSSLKKIDIKNTKTHSYSSGSGAPLEIGNPDVQRSMLPSDHSLVISVLDFKRMMHRP